MKAKINLHQVINALRSRRAKVAVTLSLLTLVLVVVFQNCSKTGTQSSSSSAVSPNSFARTARNSTVFAMHARKIKVARAGTKTTCILNNVKFVKSTSIPGLRSVAVSKTCTNGSETWHPTSILHAKNGKIVFTSRLNSRK